MSTISELIVAAIDFGTTYSGYCYAHRKKREDDELTIYANAGWKTGSTSPTSKTPTVVLFDKHKQFHSFGYDAEKKYAALAEQDEHKDWRCFRRYKMILYTRKKISLDMEIEDDAGEKMLALDVFSATIKFLKGHLIDRLQQAVDGINDSDVRWVLTVPAIWTDAAKQFMEEAAKKAGISEKHLSLAFEPEAAALFCKEAKMTKQTQEGSNDKLESFKPGAEFMVLDLGGGTVDISALKVQGDGTLKALTEPSGGPWGGTVVDDQMYKFINDLFGEDVVQYFAEESKADKLDLDQMLESKKRAVSRSDETQVLRLPLALVQARKEVRNETFKDELPKSSYKETVKFKLDRLTVSNEHFVQMFDESKDNIISHLQDLFATHALRGIRTLMLVGGLSDAEIIREAIKTAFPSYNTIWPTEGSLAIMKGAVIYGFDSGLISSRKMRFSYGISTAVPFDPEKHEEWRKYTDASGMAKCEDVFQPFILKGGDVIPNTTTEKYYFNAPATRSASQRVTVEVYKSDSKSTRFVTEENCKPVGLLALELQNIYRNEQPLIEVKMSFGNTTITVEACESGTENVVDAKFDFLI